MAKTRKSFCFYCNCCVWWHDLMELQCKWIILEHTHSTSVWLTLRMQNSAQARVDDATTLIQSNGTTQSIDDEIVIIYYYLFASFDCNFHLRQYTTGREFMNWQMNSQFHWSKFSAVKAIHNHPARSWQWWSIGRNPVMRSDTRKWLNECLFAVLMRPYVSWIFLPAD